MLKHTQQYTDFDGKSQVVDLYFNITKFEFAENLELIDQLKSLEDLYAGPERELTTAEKQLFVNLVKAVIKLGYGIRDGVHFRKDGAFEDFNATAAYSDFMWEMFQDVNKMWGFLNGMMPQEVRDEAERLAQQQNPETVSVQVDGKTNEVVSVTPVPAPTEEAEGPVDDRPDWLREGRDPTHDEVRRQHRNSSARHICARLLPSSSQKLQGSITRPLPRRKTTMQKIVVVKKIVSTAVGFAAGSVITSIIKNNTNPETTQEKVATAVGSYALGSMVGDVASRYTDAKIDHYASMINEMRNVNTPTK